MTWPPKNRAISAAGPSANERETCARPRRPCRNPARRISATGPRHCEAATADRYFVMCEERLVRRSSTSEGGSDEAIHSFFSWRDGLLRFARNDRLGDFAPPSLRFVDIPENRVGRAAEHAGERFPPVLTGNHLHSPQRRGRRRPAGAFRRPSRLTVIVSRTVSSKSPTNGTLNESIVNVCGVTVTRRNPALS